MKTIFYRQERKDSLLSSVQLVNCSTSSRQRRAGRVRKTVDGVVTQYYYLGWRTPAETYFENQEATGGLKAAVAAASPSSIHLNSEQKWS